MLYTFAFDRLGVAVGDLYFKDPDPGPGQEGAEQGVRLELRCVERADPPGSIYSALPITLGRPAWRVDLLESVDNPGSLDRTHHHPRFAGWEPGRRVFVPELSADPLGWLDARLADPDALFDQTGLGADEATPADAAALVATGPEIVATVRTLLDRVRAGEAARPPAEGGDSIRSGWL